ncbi:hypothetical protein Y032_0119g789 [Ancylostoma ceylanicum]|uniref:Ataxin-10 n=1 Tax=Ancylostoma ceylanicum TaxID=53326 RepID=A0A016TB10_9BILA|nr:hypothetical protein Y032_0119g789 [Ancylostoma ceylanicum]
MHHYLTTEKFKRVNAHYAKVMERDEILGGLFSCWIHPSYTPPWSEFLLAPVKRPLRIYRRRVASVLQTIIRLKLLRVYRYYCWKGGYSFFKGSTRGNPRLGADDLKASLLGLLNVSLEGRGDEDTGGADIRRARLALRTVVNAVNRSKRFAESVSPDCLELFRALLRVPELRTETFAALVALSRSMRIVCGLEDSYTTLIGELALLWESQNVSDSDRSWLSALVSIHLEEDFGFLSGCFGDLSSDEFTAILHITEVLMDSSHNEAITKVHVNNISFCVDLLERILHDFGEGIASERRLAYVEQSAYCIEILASAALRESEFSAPLLDRPVAVEMIVDILESVLDAQWLDENEEQADLSVQTHPDRPQKVPDVRCARVRDCPRLTALSAAVRDSPMEVRATLKCAAVRAIGNFCCERPALRIAAGSKGAVLAILRCARLTENDRPFIVQWSIAALRFLCLGCPDNQRIILEMDQKPTGVIDRQKLLKELGIEVEVDPASGAVRLLNRSGNH